MRNWLRPHDQDLIMCNLYTFALDIGDFRPLLSLRYSERRGRSLVACTTVV